MMLDELQAIGVGSSRCRKASMHDASRQTSVSRTGRAGGVRAGPDSGTGHGWSGSRSCVRQASWPSTATLAAADVERTLSMSVRQAAIVLGVPRSVLHRARLSRKPHQNAHQI